MPRLAGLAGSLVCELRSVNHRYLEVTVRLPEELRPLEPELRAQLQKELRRGKVDCIFTYPRHRSVRPGPAGGCGTARPPDARPGPAGGRDPVIGGSAAGQPRGTAALSRRVARIGHRSGSAAGQRAQPCLRSALADLKRMRASEGARLNELVRQRCDQLAGTGRPGARDVCRKYRPASVPGLPKGLRS